MKEVPLVNKNYKEALMQLFCILNCSENVYDRCNDISEDNVCHDSHSISLTDKFRIEEATALLQDYGLSQQLHLSKEGKVSLRHLVPINLINDEELLKVLINDEELLIEAIPLAIEEVESLTQEEVDAYYLSLKGIDKNHPKINYFLCKSPFAIMIETASAAIKNLRASKRKSQ